MQHNNRVTPEERWHMGEDTVLELSVGAHWCKRVELFYFFYFILSFILIYFFIIH